jgi:ADP-ribosylglycohydrolase
MSAGNGAAMRAAIIGTFFDQQEGQRATFGRALAEVTHRDPRAVEGALYVAELAAACARSPLGTRLEACQDDPLLALSEVISAGGDTDSTAAIVGGWLGAWHGQAELPGDLILKIHDGPFGPTHLRALADCLARVQRGESAACPRYSVAAALGRNLALYPVILGHGLRRLIPF